MSSRLKIMFVFFYIIFMFVTVNFFGDEGCGCGGKTVTVATIKPPEAMKLIQNLKGNLSFIILDVRTPEEYQQGHIEGAINLNYYDSNFKKQLSELSKSKIYLVYCYSGARSSKVVDMMKRLKFTSVYNLYGGIMNWEKYKFPLTTK